VLSYYNFKVHYAFSVKRPESPELLRGKEIQVENSCQRKNKPVGLGHGNTWYAF
jgi:hypothetical protein